jgi:outer membrane receptor for ferrienterochelin and colicin
LSYNQRISRPGIWYLNPFLDSSNPRSLSQGNPDLKSEIDNSFSLNYSYMTQKLNCNVNLYTSFTNNSIESVSSLLNDTVQYATFKNIGLSQNTGLSLYGGWQPTTKIRFNINGSVNYSSMSTNDGSGLSTNGVGYSFSGGGQFTLPADIKFGMNGGYYSSRVSLQGKSSDFYYYSTSVSRDFLSKKLNVSFYARNPFEKNTKYTSYTETSDFRVDNVSTRIARSFGLSISYRFGQLKAQIKKAQRGISNDDVKGGGGQGGGGGQ